MMDAIIYKPTKNVMQSGLGNTKKWVLTLLKSSSSTQEKLMGYPSSLSNTNQVKIFFDTKENAIIYAQNNGYSFKVVENILIKRNKKNYTFNFTKDPNLYYY